MHIAPGVHVNVWRGLHLENPASLDWAIAIEILSKRIRGRYLDPINSLIEAEKHIPPVDRRFGFAVLAIDCLLVETLGAFLDGLEDTEDKSKATFCRFLTTRKRFSIDFNEATAKVFYKHFRCGILHQAETGKHSLIWSIGPLVRLIGDSLIVNRNEFHQRLTEEFSTYLAELADPTEATLRKNFRKKMNFIARMTVPS